jgi:hypothetical protein
MAEAVEIPSASGVGMPLRLALKELDLTVLALRTIATKVSISARPAMTVANMVLCFVTIASAELMLLV